MDDLKKTYLYPWRKTFFKIEILLFFTGLYNDALIVTNMALEISPQVVVTHFTMANIFVSKVNIVHLLRYKKDQLFVYIFIFIQNYRTNWIWLCLFI